MTKWSPTTRLLLGDHAGGCGGGAPGGEQVVDDEDAVAGTHGVVVHFEGVGAVFEVVGDADAGGGEFLGFAHGDEAGAEGVGECGGEDEAAGFDADDGIDLLAAGIVR